MISATVNGSFSDCNSENASDDEKAPDMYVEFRVAGQTKETETVQGHRSGGNWVGAWVSDRACVTLDGDVAGNDGVTVVVKDSDWGVSCLKDWTLDFTDDTLGHCTLFSDGINFAYGQSRLRIGGSDCNGQLMGLELKFTAFPKSS